MVNKEREANIAALNDAFRHIVASPLPPAEYNLLQDGLDAVTLFNIPRSRQNPKILWVDDAEVVRDRIAQLRPVLRDFLA